MAKFQRGQALFPLLVNAMSPKPALCTLGAAAALFALVVFPPPSQGQAQNEDALLSGLLVEVTAQQTVIAENQTKIDEKIALIAEDVRVARIFAGRVGGGGNK